MPFAQSTIHVQTVLPFFMFDGMTLLLGAFFFYGLADPTRVRNRSPFWGVFACLLLIVLLYTLRLMLYTSPAGQVLTGVAIGLLQAAGLVLTVLYAGGLRLNEVADEMKAAADFRRGGPREPTAAPKPAPAEPVKADPVAPPPPSPAPAAPRVVIDLPKSPPDA